MLLLVLLIARLRLSHYCDLILPTVFYASEMPFVESDVATSSPTRGCRRFSVYSRIEYSSANMLFWNSKDAIPIEAEVKRQKRKKSGDVYQ